MNTQIKIFIAIILTITSSFQSVYGYNVTASLDDESYLNSVPKWMLPLVYSQGKLEEDVKYLHEAAVDNKNAIVMVRQEMKEGFDKVDQRFVEAKKDVDQRFDKVDQRFAEAKKDVDQRFDKVDQRFDKVDQRFDKVDQRFDKIEALLATDRQDQIDFGKNITEILQTSLKEMREVHEKFANRTEVRLEKLEAHWTNNFGDFVIYNPLTYAALAAAVGAVKVEAAGMVAYGAYALYALSAVLVDQVFWSLVAPTVPVSISLMVQQAITVAACASIYALHVNQNVIAPKITLGNIASIAVIGGAIGNGKNILAWIENLFKNPGTKLD